MKRNTEKKNKLRKTLGAERTSHAYRTEKVIY